MKNTIYSVKASGNISTLGKLEVKIYEFFTSKEFLSVVKVGDSYSEKKLKNQFASWNDEKMTVALNSIVNEKHCKNVCRFFASQVKSGLLKSSVIPTLHENKAHGNFSIDFVDASTLSTEYSDKELTEKKKTEKDALTFVMEYLSKEKTQEKITLDDARNDKINAIVALLETLKK